MKIWIVASSEAELAQLRVDLQARPAGTAGRLPFYAGRLKNARIYLGAVGVGVTAAALALGGFLTAKPADQAIMVGSAGAFRESGMEVGDVAVATAETLAELGLCAGRGVGDAQALGLSGLDQTLYLDQDLFEALAQSAHEPCCARMGPFLSVVGVSDNEKQAATRATWFRVIVENMEGYALALASRRFGCKVGEVRGISNLAGVRDKSSWNLDLANMRAQEAVLNYLRREL
jgi:futalosine hydrolase